jgi:uncharacterized membrane protein SpoIIM required for sporulation
LSEPEFEEFVQLYRSTCADLALARTQSENLELSRFLDSICGRAYCLLYRRPGVRLGAAIQRALIETAQTFRRRFVFFLASLAVFLIALFYNVIVLSARPDLHDLIVDPRNPMFGENLERWKRGKFDPRTADESGMATAFYASHNPRVALTTAALSASTFGIGTCQLIWLNGEVMGIYCYEMSKVGKLDYFLTSVSPHGASEMTGAIVSGSAGFVMAWALISPGRRTRGQALKAAGADAFRLTMLSMVMMFIAAPFEGYFSFNPQIPAPFKIAVFCIMATFWTLYFYGYGRNEELEPAG